MNPQAPATTDARKRETDFDNEVVSALEALGRSSRRGSGRSTGAI